MPIEASSETPLSLACISSFDQWNYTVSFLLFFNYFKKIMIPQHFRIGLLWYIQLNKILDMIQLNLEKQTTKSLCGWQESEGYLSGRWNDGFSPRIERTIKIPAKIFEVYQIKSKLH